MIPLETDNGVLAGVYLIALEAETDVLTGVELIALFFLTEHINLGVLAGVDVIALECESNVCFIFLDCLFTKWWPYR